MNASSTASLRGTAGTCPADNRKQKTKYPSANDHIKQSNLL